MEATVLGMVGRRCIAATLAALSLLSIIGALPAVAATTSQAGRPHEFVAYARVAVVRLTVAYYAKTQTASQSGLTPLPTLCTGLGTLVATTGASGGNPRSYILTDARLVSPVTPCASAVAAYLNANQTPPAGWQLYQITAYLNSAYSGSGTAPNASGATGLDVDISAIATLGLTDGAIVLPLTHEPAYDLPVAVVSQTQPTATTQIIDLGAAGGQLYTQDALTAATLNDTLTPIETSAATPPLVPTTTSAPTPASTATPAAATTPVATAIPATPVSAPAISLGAPVIDDEGNGFGNLAGMVVMTANGLNVVGVDAINAALHQAAAASNPGEFDQRWHAGLDAYYKASPTNPKDASYAAAAQQFAFLQASYPDFHGVADWLSAARAGSPDLGATTTPAAASGDLIPGIPIQSRSELVIAIAAVGLVLLLVIILVVVVARNGRRRRRSQVRDTVADRDATAMVSAVVADADNDERRINSEELPSHLRTMTLRPTAPLPRNRRRLRLGFHAAARTHPGVRRRDSPNQDNILVVQGARLHEGQPQAFGLFVVADGMGGHSFGREASSRAIEVMVDQVLQPLLDGHDLTEDEMLDILKMGVERANESLHDRNVHQSSDMGTTVTAALVTGDIAHVVNVGDSRTYHLKTDQPLLQVTNDHSVVASLVSAGIIHPDDIYTHPRRNQIFRSLGEKEDVQVDTFQVVLHPGDKLLLCSDGLWEMIRDPQIEDILRNEHDVGDATDALIDEANANGGVDNVSAIVVDMMDERAIPSQTGVHFLVSPDTIKRK